MPGTSAVLEAAESELVEPFDFSIQLSPSCNSSTGKDVDKEGENQLRLQGSETAADSMSTFIEFTAAEKARLTEVTSCFLPNHRYSTVAYTERFMLGTIH